MVNLSIFQNKTILFKVVYHLPNLNRYLKIKDDSGSKCVIKFHRFKNKNKKTPQTLKNNISTNN